MAGGPSPPFALLAAAAFLAMAAPVTGNHVQTDGGKVVVFDHVAGNEWWVEVRLTGQDAGSVSLVEAQDTNGAWVALTKRSWGPHAASFHIEPGHQVRFRATWPGGAQSVSCWFTHPAGVEQCAPNPWRTTLMGDAGAAAWTGDMAVSDVDNDGRRDVSIAHGDGLRTFEWTGSAWAKEVVSPHMLGSIAGGDGDGDGANELYSVGFTDGALHRFAKGSTGWSDQVVATFPEPVPADLTLGNIDGVAGPELYVGMYDGVCDDETGLCSFWSNIYWVRKSAGVWTSTAIANLTGHVDSLWIGDGDRNGSPELYVGHGTRHADRTTQVLRHQGQWVTAALPGYGSDSGMALAVVGDADHDGKQEVYVANWDGVVRRMAYDQVNGWSNDVLVPDTGHSHISLFVGDADNDGKDDLFLGAWGGELVQVRWTGAGWTTQTISTPTVPGLVGDAAFVVVGDGDGDGRREAYFAAGFLDPEYDSPGVTRLYKVDVPGPTAFDAAFTGVKGNEWWQQVSVSATGGTLAKVEVRLNGGAWQPMAKQSYGWTSSLRAVDGTVVQFRATGSVGATDESQCYRWIPPAGATAPTVACGSDPTPPTFDATFSGVKGNAWWVQASVSGNAPIAAVHARIDCTGDWKPLTKQSYGWAASFHVPDGSQVDFRATSTGGATDLSAGYTWPAASPAPAC